MQQRGEVGDVMVARRVIRPMLVLKQINGWVFYFSIKRKTNHFQNAISRLVSFPSIHGIRQITHQLYHSPLTLKAMLASKYQLFLKLKKERW